MPNDSFAIRLREARRMRKLSMDKLIELADFVVTKQSLSRYERGVMRPHANVLSALAKALDISEEYFLGTNLNINIPMLRTTSGGKLQEDVLTAIEARLSFWTKRLIANVRLASSKSLRIPSKTFRYPHLKMPSKQPTSSASSGIAATVPSPVYFACWNARASESWRTNFLPMFMASAHGQTIVCRS